MELAFERRGDGPPLVLLHGIGHHWQAWEPVIDLLARSRDVIAVDFPGFGVSPPLPAGTPYTPETLADAVESFCAHLGVRDPHVAGNSLGGYVALTLAARGVVRTATALSPAGFWVPSEARLAQAMLLALRGLTRTMPPERTEALARSAVGRTMSMGFIVARPARMTPEAVIAGGRALRDAVGFDETLRSFRAVVPPGRPKVPITIAWGEHDRLLLRRQAVRAAKWSEQRVKLLRGCGHVPMSDDPELVARVLLEGSSH
ncbi:alpha/beta fold hydrolase [Sphaerisporangium perillae]|uniref:alpha/beta fold hydrolase n=1 Tax=Sphaerisporangium perillae TaxID=2935860 RepID=UPI00200E98E2|nr:alpha/beta hydrolase [Sphaerisporangium perillae]